MSDEREELGCAHYKRHCRLVAPCCAKVYSCRCFKKSARQFATNWTWKKWRKEESEWGRENVLRKRWEKRERKSRKGKFCTLRFCHDEAEPTHSLDRKKVEEVECLKCSTRYWEVSLYFVKPHPMSPKNNRIWQGPCWSWMQAMWGCLWLCLLLQRLQVTCYMYMREKLYFECCVTHTVVPSELTWCLPWRLLKLYDDICSGCMMTLTKDSSIARGVGYAGWFDFIRIMFKLKVVEFD